MQTVLFGKIINNDYRVNSHRDPVDETRFLAKPEMNIRKTTLETPEILRFDGEPYYNNSSKKYATWSFFGSEYECLNISEDETVYIENRIFRADLNELHLFTDKILEVNENNKEEKELLLESELRAFNEQMIESNEDLKRYCNIHHLFYDITDCEELWKIVFPDKEFEYKDGKMIIKETNCILSKGLALSNYAVSNAIATINK